MSVSYIRIVGLLLSFFLFLILSHAFSFFNLSPFSFFGKSKNDCAIRRKTIDIFLRFCYIKIKKEVGSIDFHVCALYNEIKINIRKKENPL